MKKKLHLDGKKRITLGKLISKDTTYFEVEKKPDGAIILIPKTNIKEDELWIYRDKKTYASLKKGLKDLKKGLTTKINPNFWMGV